MSFADITVVGITGADSYTEGTMYAVARSCAELPGSRGLLISPSCPQDLPENIRHQPCRPFGYLEYNLRPLQNSPKSPKFPSRHLGDFP